MSRHIRGGMSRRAGRPALTREQIVTAALELLNEVGLDALSTRRLAERLGVQVGALYWHVAGKRDLLAAMADRIVEEFTTRPPAEGGWEERVAQEARRLRRVMRAHRDGARVVVASIGLAPNLPAVAERFLAILREAGFSLETAAHGWDAIASFVTGFVLQEQSAPVNLDELPEGVRGLVLPVDERRFPNLAEWLARGQHDPDSYFDARVALIIDGLRARLPAEGKTGGSG